MHDRGNDVVEKGDQAVGMFRPGTLATLDALSRGGEIPGVIQGDWANPFHSRHAWLESQEGGARMKQMERAD